MSDNIQDYDLKDELIADRKVGFFRQPVGMSNWIYKTIITIDKFSLLIGKIVSWITVPLFLCMAYEVIARKFFLSPTYWAYDMSRFFYGAMFMLGSGYALSRGVHIRADFLYRNFKIKTQGMVDFWLYIFFYFCWVSNLFYSNFFRVCVWLSRFWKISFLFNDIAILHGHDRTNFSSSSTFCFYGYHDGTSRFNGKIIFSFSINVSKS